MYINLINNRFPLQGTHLRQQWDNILRHFNVDYMWNETSLICSLHFDVRDILQTTTNGVIHYDLRPNAVPKFGGTDILNYAHNHTKMENIDRNSIKTEPLESNIQEYVQNILIICIYQMDYLCI